AASCSEIMLNRIAKREEITAGAFESVAKRDQFLPAIDCDKPPVLQIASEFLRLDPKIDNVGVGPDKRVKRLDVGNCRTICFPAMHAYSAGFAQLSGHNPRRWIRAKEQRVFLKFHVPSKFVSFRAKSRNLLLS